MIDTDFLLLPSVLIDISTIHLSTSMNYEFMAIEFIINGYDSVAVTFVSYTRSKFWFKKL